MPKFRIVTPAGASFSNSGGGYSFELEALENLDAEIVECPTTEDGFIAAARGADAIYAKGMKFNTVDPAPFRAKLKSAGFYDEWKKKFGDAAWTTLEASVGSLS